MTPVKASAPTPGGDREQSRQEQTLTEYVAPQRHEPEIQRRVDVGDAQITCDGRQCGVPGLQLARQAGRKHSRWPVRPRHARSQKQRVLLIVFRPAQPGGEASTTAPAAMSRKTRGRSGVG